MIDHADNRRRLRRPLVPLLLLTLLTLMIAQARSACAQGASGRFPGPISSDELSRWAERLELSDAQRDAVETMYAAYLDEFLALRDGPIRQYLRAYPNPNAIWVATAAEMLNPPQAASELRRLNTRIASLDGALLDRAQGLLTDDQTPPLQRIRTERQCTRYRKGPAAASYSDYLRADLGAILDGLALAPEAQAAVNAIRPAYEQQLLAALRQLDAMMTDLHVDLAEQVQGGFVPHQVVYDAATRIGKLSGDVGAAHRRFLAQAEAVLPEAPADELRRRFCRRVYSEAPADLGPALRFFRDVLDEDDLTAVRRAVVQEQSAAFRLAARPLHDQMLDTIDDLRRSDASHGIRLVSSFVYEDEAVYAAKLEALKARLHRLNESAARALGDAVGRAFSVASPDRDEEQRLAELWKNVRWGMRLAEDGAQMYFTSGIPVEQLALEFGLPGGGGSNRFLPAPIPARNLHRYARLLGIDETEAPLLASVHDTYLLAFEDLEEAGAAHQARRLQRTFFAPSPDGRVHVPSIEEVDALFELRRKALRDARAADDAFFRDLELIWGDRVDAAVFQRLRRVRQRQLCLLAGPARAITNMPRPVYSLGPHEYMGAGNRSPQRLTIEFAELLDQLAADVPTDRLAEARALLEGHEIRATELRQRLFEARLELEHWRARLMAQTIRADEDGSYFFESISTGGAFTEHDARVHELLEETRRADREIADQLAAALPTGAAWGLRAAFSRAAHPGVFEDRGALHDVLARAAALEDLDRTQTADLAALHRRYVGEYEDASGRMIEVRNDFEQWLRRRSERRELNKRARAELEGMLTEDQLHRLWAAEER